MKTNESVGELCPEFSRPPVLETHIVVQFQPLDGFRVAHFGLFLQHVLGESDWPDSKDMAPLPHDVESLDSPILSPSWDLTELEGSTPLRVAYRSVDKRTTIHLQQDKIVFARIRAGEPRPSYRDLRAAFDPLFARFEEFCGRHSLGEIKPDLWSVYYVNTIPQGDSWEMPADWSRVLPGLFPTAGPKVLDHDWTTFNGTWYFLMPDRSGRVRVEVSKAIPNQGGDPVLLMTIHARGPLGENSTATWQEGLDIGHDSVVRVFYDLASDAAKSMWGEKR